MVRNRVESEGVRISMGRLNEGGKEVVTREEKRRVDAKDGNVTGGVVNISIPKSSF